jgi:hypothetical protein
MLFWLECKKILKLPIITVAVFGCIALNIFTCYMLKVNDNHVDSSTPPENVFADYQTSKVADSIIGYANVKGKNAENIREIYSELQTVVDEKSKNGDALSKYFGEATYYRHEALFGTVFGYLIAECGILIAFIALLSANYENARNTELLVYTTKKGRGLFLTKFISGLAVGMVLSAIIFAVTLVYMISTFDFWRVWGENVSSCFNAIGGMGEYYVTWQSLTVGQEFWAYIGVSFLLLIVFNLFGFALGTTFRNGYVAFAVGIAFNVVTLILKLLFPIGSGIRAFLNIMPAWQWANVKYWFTKGDIDVIWKNFECVGVGVSLLFFGAVSAVLFRLFKKTDIN